MSSITRFSRTSGRNLAEVRRPQPAVTKKAAAKAAKKAETPTKPSPPETNDADVESRDG